MSARVLIHVQHLLGTGHLRRAAALAQALADAGLAVELMSGGFPVGGIDFGGVKATQLSPARAADATFKPILGIDDRPIDAAWKAARRAAVLARFDDFAPDVLITELFPFGRRMFAFELMALIEAAHARAKRPLILASLRDVLTRSDDRQKSDESVARTIRFYDRVLVHGDPKLIALEASFPAAPRLGGRLVYTGYVAGPPAPSVADRAGEGEIIVSAGGGAVGGRLLGAAIEARARLSGAGAPEGSRTWRVLVGGNLPATEMVALGRAAGPGLVVEPARADFPGLLRRCHLSVSQAGYNTVVDLLCAGARAVLVPFAEGGESEQTLRARALAARGRAEVVSEAELTPARLADAIRREAASPPPSPSSVRLDGAEESARLIARWLGERQSAAS